MDDDDQPISYTISPIISILSYLPATLLYFSQIMDRSMNIMTPIFTPIFKSSRTLYTRIYNVFPFTFFFRHAPPSAPPTPTEIYLGKYIDELKKSINNTTTSTHKYLGTRTVMENTPTGSVAMQYEADRAAFIYYANTSIPTKILNVVARKYAIQFHATDLLKRGDPLETTTEANKDKDKQKGTKTGGGMHSGKIGARFAKLKNAANPSVEENKNKNKNKDTETSEPRFICVGRITDMNVLRPPPKENVTHNKTNSTLTFADFKKQLVTR